MAKRRRLTPAQADYLAPPGPLEVKAWLRPGLPEAAAPIARVAGEASAEAALAEVAATLASARAEGRLVESLPLGAIETDHLVRDRLPAEEDGLSGLMASLAEHGQRTPVEVTPLGHGRYGLISGWRRVTALARLAATTGEARFGRVLALVRQPASAAAAYVAMVEENEVRLGLSYYERARIVGKAVDLGVFETEAQGLRALFAGASRARRSKIGSFLAIWRTLDPALRFPAAIPERLGLALARRIGADPAFAGRLSAALSADPAPDAAAELARLSAALRDALPGKARKADQSLSGTPRVSLRQSGAGRLVLSGPGVDAAFLARLQAWLAQD
jgi:hypothetical protein